MWVSKSMDKLADALTAAGHAISADTVKKELGKLGFSRQHNRKADEGSKHPDRNASCRRRACGTVEHINAKVIAAQAAGQPVISVDTKKKELIGNYKNGGSDYRPKGQPARVKVHDFVDKELGKVAPYGIYDVTANAGFVPRRSRLRQRSALPPTRRNSPCNRSAAGGIGWGSSATLT